MRSSSVFSSTTHVRESRVGALRADRVRLARHLLEQEVEAAPDRPAGPAAASGLRNCSTWLRSRTISSVTSMRSAASASSWCRRASSITPISASSWRARRRSRSRTACCDVARARLERARTAPAEAREPRVEVARQRRALRRAHGGERVERGVERGSTAPRSSSPGHSGSISRATPGSASSSALPQSSRTRPRSAPARARRAGTRAPPRDRPRGAAPAPPLGRAHAAVDLAALEALLDARAQLVLEARERCGAGARARRGGAGSPSASRPRRPRRRRRKEALPKPVMLWIIARPAPPPAPRAAAAFTSSALAVAVPTFPTTTPDAAFAITAASNSERARAQRQRQRGDRGVAGALHVEHLARRRRHVHARRRRPRTATCRPARASPPPRLRRSCGAAAPPRGAGRRGCGSDTPESGSASRRLGLSSAAPFQGDEVGLRIDRHRHAAPRGSGASRRRATPPRQHALAVVLARSRRETRGSAASRPRAAARGRPRGGSGSAVSRSKRTICCVRAITRVLRVVGRPGTTDDALRRDAEILEQLDQAAPGGVVADHRAALDRAAERHHVAHRVGRAAEHHRLVAHVHHRHRRLRAHALDLAPHVLVEHQVADHEQAHAREARRSGARGDGGRVGAWARHGTRRCPRARSESQPCRGSVQRPGGRVQRRAALGTRGVAGAPPVASARDARTPHPDPLRRAGGGDLHADRAGGDQRDPAGPQPGPRARRADRTRASR